MQARRLCDQQLQGLPRGTDLVASAQVQTLKEALPMTAARAQSPTEAAAAVGDVVTRHSQFTGSFARWTHRQALYYRRCIALLRASCVHF